MLCLGDSIRYDDPSLQRLLHTMEEMQTLTDLLVAVWLLARGLAMHIRVPLARTARHRPMCGLLLP